VVDFRRYTPKIDHAARATPLMPQLTFAGAAADDGRRR
jgi:hypothetical protein